MSRLDLSSIPVLTGTGYPDPFAEAVSGRSRQALGAAGGITGEPPRDGTPYPQRAAPTTPGAAQLPIEAETLRPRVFQANHGEQDEVIPDRVNPDRSR